MTNYLRKIFYRIIPIEVSASSFVDHKDTVLSNASTDDIKSGFNKIYSQVKTSDSNDNSKKVYSQYDKIFK